jgi:hypothetical protein
MPTPAVNVSVSGLHPRAADLVDGSAGSEANRS